MKLIKTTETKLKYYEDRLNELQENLDSGKLTKDCTHYVQGEIEKAIDNIIYYRGILEVLERIDDLSDYQF